MCPWLVGRVCPWLVGRVCPWLVGRVCPWLVGRVCPWLVGRVPVNRGIWVSGWKEELRHCDGRRPGIGQSSGPRHTKLTTRSGDNSQSDERSQGRQDGKAGGVIVGLLKIALLCGTPMCSTLSSLACARFARDV